MKKQKDPLDEDPFDVKNWEDLFKWCVKNAKNKEFFKKISDFIYISNDIEAKRFNIYIKKRAAEIKSGAMNK